ncbi:hypothetical protein Tco_0728502 [Tanacetum coccineum]|uniref:Synaptobrevin, longin-like domain protein n=1 Tax=Tanacetum coccineum TaxID=301880 RepID=A0ABQ4YMC8_9ASTR
MRLSIRSWVTEWKGLPLLLLAKKQSRTVVSRYHIGDVDAQTRFEITSKQSIDPPLSRGYTLESGEDNMKLLELMEFCTQLLYKNRKSVLATAKVQTVNGVRQLQALVDKKIVIVTESSIRKDLHLDDAEGTDCLLTATIFEELARMGYEKPSQKLTFYKAFFSPQWKYFIHTITQCLSAKSTAWNEFSSSMASLIICLATNQKFNLSKYIFDAMVKHLDGGVKFLMYIRFLQVFINRQLGNMSTHKKIFVNPFHTKKVFANMKRAGQDFSGRITPLFDTMMVQVSKEVGEDSDHPTDSTQIPIINQPSSSSQPKKKQPSKKAQKQEAEVPQDETEHEESGQREKDKEKEKNERSTSREIKNKWSSSLQMKILDAPLLLQTWFADEEDAQAKEIAALKKRIQRLERKKMSRPTGLKRLMKVGMSRRVKSSEDQESLGAPEDASKQGRSIADIDADVEMPMEAKVDKKDKQSTKPDDSIVGEAVTTASVEDSPAPTIIKEIILSRTLIQIKAAKPKVVNTAATTTTTRPKARGVVVQEPIPLKRKDQIALDEQIARDIQAKLDAELIEEKKLARKQEEEANIALIESWENTQAMMEADRLMAERLQSREREELTDEEKGKLFMELMEKRRKHFVSSRAQEMRNDLPTKAQKKLKLNKEGNTLWAMVLRKRVGKEQQQESSKKLKVEKEKESDKFEELIRADGSSKRYSSMIRMLQGIDREDLEALWRIVKTKYSDIRPEDEFERVLWGDLKVMFEPDKRSDVWRILQGYRVTIWKLIDSSGVHFVRFDNLHIFMLVEKRYPLTPITITNMLNKKLQTDHQNEMCYQLLKLMVKQQKGQ